MSRASALALVTLVAVTACSSEPLAIGIPEEWSAGIEEGHERYPVLGPEGDGSGDWPWPFVETIEVDGEPVDQAATYFWRVTTGVYTISCEFEDPVIVTLSFTQAEDDAAFGALVAHTEAHLSSGTNEVESTVAIGEREYFLATTTNPEDLRTDGSYTACYLDETGLARACLQLRAPQTDGLDAESAATMLSDLLTS